LRHRGRKRHLFFNISIFEIFTEKDKAKKDHSLNPKIHIEHQSDDGVGKEIMCNKNRMEEVKDQNSIKGESIISNAEGSARSNEVPSVSTTILFFYSISQI
jgi:hypothetical protein